MRWRGRDAVYHFVQQRRVHMRSVLLTGRHMGHTVVRGNSTQPIVIRPDQPTLASMLKGAGYRTAC